MLCITPYSIRKAITRVLKLENYDSKLVYTSDFCDVRVLKTFRLNVRAKHSIAVSNRLFLSDLILEEEFADTKGVIRIHKSKKDRQHNGEKKKKKKKKEDKQRSAQHTHKTKDRVTRTPIKTGSELMCSGRVSSSCSTSVTRRVNLVTNPMTSRE